MCYSKLVNFKFILYSQNPVHFNLWYFLAMQQQLQRAAVSGMRAPGLSLFAQRGVAAGIRGQTVAQHAAASLAGRIRAPPQVFSLFF